MIFAPTVEVAPMSEVDAKSALTLEVARLILSDPRYASDDWQDIAIVYNFLDGRENTFGYVFFPDGKWEARLPDDHNWDAVDKMLELQTMMERETGKRWLRALFHIKRDDQSMNIQFEYDDREKWMINPGDLEKSVAALKP